MQIFLMCFLSHETRDEPLRTPAWDASLLKSVDILCIYIVHVGCQNFHKVSNVWLNSGYLQKEFTSCDLSCENHTNGYPFKQQNARLLNG